MKPKCLENAGSLAWSATGHLLPCCWYDNQNKKYISELVQDKFNLKDNTVQEVLDSEEWKEFIEAQKYANIKAPSFKKSRSDYFRIYWVKLKNK